MKEPFDSYDEEHGDSDDREPVEDFSQEDLFQENDRADADAEVGEETNQEFDPIKSYLKGISSIPLLTKQGEVEIARRMETGRDRIAVALSTIPFVIKKLILLGKLIETGEAPLIDLIRDGEDMSDEDLLAEKERITTLAREISDLYNGGKGQTMCTVGVDCSIHNAIFFGTSF